MEGIIANEHWAELVAAKWQYDDMVDILINWLKTKNEGKTICLSRESDSWLDMRLDFM